MYRIITPLLTFFLCFSLSANWDPSTLTENEKSDISDIFTTLGEKSVASLVFETFRLRRLGKKIEHVPPLQFLAFLMSDPYLKDCIREVSTSYFKWAPFVDGIKTNMEIEMREERLFLDLPNFATLLESDLEQLKSLCLARKWEEFIKSLL